jgi:acyl-coenzyme A synthetase/AMP-(fatty) acid ligase
MLPHEVGSLRSVLLAGSDCSDRFLYSTKVKVCLSDLLRGSFLAGRLPELSGRSVLIRTHDQLETALALIELDGVARRLIVCPPDLSPEHLPSLVKDSGVDAIVTDANLLERSELNNCLRVNCSSTLVPADRAGLDQYATEWVLLTSGTTGAPKMLVHSLRSLTAAIKSKDHEGAIVWGTFYDMRRYGGLQIFLRAVLGNGSFVLSSVDEALGDYLVRLGAHAVTHILGTPSHWRRVLMSPFAHEIAPRYVRLSGEIADQAILNKLRLVYPQAGITHAFASTEAGVGFEVDDGLEGFPASIVDRCGEVEFEVRDNSLRMRSARTAARYIGVESLTLADDQGFVDTGDIVERRGGRYYFLGRRGGVINVGGLKVHPEEVEAIINRHPQVRMSRVRSRRNPVTGSIVVADVVLKLPTECGIANSRVAEVEQEILQLCRETLPRHKSPTAIYFVPNLEISASGKVLRNYA